MLLASHCAWLAHLEGHCGLSGKTPTRHDVLYEHCFIIRFIAIIICAAAFAAAYSATASVCIL